MYIIVSSGWIVHPSQSQDPEGYTLNQWASAKLKEAMRQREEAKLTAKLRGEDGPLLVSYYSDSHTRSLRGPRHHHRTTSLPLPTVLSKLPPSLLGSVGSSEAHHTPVIMSSEAPLCLLQLPDGSGLCKYVHVHVCCGRICICCVLYYQIEARASSSSYL